MEQNKKPGGGGGGLIGELVREFERLGPQRPGPDKEGGEGRRGRGSQEEPSDAREAEGVGAVIQVENSGEVSGAAT